MNKIEIKWHRGKTGVSNDKRYVVINGEADIEGEYEYWGTDQQEELKWSIVSNKAYELVCETPFAELSSHFTRIALNDRIKSTRNGSSGDENYSISLNMVGIPNTTTQSMLTILLYPDVREWSKSYSPREFGNQFVSELNKLEDISIMPHDFSDGPIFSIGLSYVCKPSDSPGIYLEFVKRILFETVNTAEVVLKTRVNDNALTTYFRFPKGIETACSQYLLYFAQFLEDLGIEADTEVKQDVNETLFKITPRNKTESLQKIKEALEMFLDAPNYPNLRTELIQSSDIAAIQFQSNIMHLQSQMMLHQATIQAKDAALQAKDSAIQNLKLTNFQLVEKLEEFLKAEGESVIPGVVSVEKYKVSFLSFDFPEMVRKLKRRFKL